MKLISIVTPTFNEQENIQTVYDQIKKVFKSEKKYNYEHIFIDNSSTDGTVELLKKIARKDKRVKIIVNSRNFGWIRSPFYGMLQAKGDAVVLLVADLQDPPALINRFIRKWESGRKVVIGIKNSSEENKLTYLIRSSYYRFLSRISEIDLINDFMGFGLYDKVIIEKLRQMEDTYPYFRGLVSELGDTEKIEYKQLTRKHGQAKGDFYKLLDVAVLGITTYSRFPLRVITLLGLISTPITLLITLGFIGYSIFTNQWTSFGSILLTMALLFFSSVQVLFIGIIGEYVGIIHTRVLKRPLVIEKERINFN